MSSSSFNRAIENVSLRTQWGSISMAIFNLARQQPTHSKFIQADFPVSRFDSDKKEKTRERNRL